MTIRFTDETIRAYETLLEEAKLELYFRHHVAPLNKKDLKSSQEQEEEDDNDEEEQEEEESVEEQEEEEEEEEEDSSNAAISCVEEDENEEGSNDQDDLSSWSNAELDLFFFSLQRRGRIRCGLIAEDLGGSKSISQVAHLIHLFEQAKQSRVKRNALKKKEITPIAIEVSNEWIEIEQAISTRLQDWEENKYQKLGQSPFNEDTHAASPKIDWDTQVLNSILFLRHKRQLDPTQNEKNLSVKKTSKSTEKHKVFSFTISDLANLLHNLSPSKNISSFSFRSFANDHCVPKIKSTSSDPRVWRIILGSLRFGHIVPIHIKQSGTKANRSMQAILNEQPDLISEATIESLQNSPEQRLVWWDSLPYTDETEALTKRLNQVRKVALHQLLRSLKRKEFKEIMAMAHADNLTPEKEANDKGKKRGIVEDVTNVKVAMRKKRKNATGGGKVTTSSELWHKRMNRFDRIGVCKEDLLELLKPDFCLEDQTLFHTKTINKIFKLIKERNKLSSSCERISLHVLSTFTFCLRFFLYRIMELITNQISHSLRPDAEQSIAEITPDDIYQALALVNQTSDADHDQINFEVDLYERNKRSSNDQSNADADDKQADLSTDGDQSDVNTDDGQSHASSVEEHPILNVFEPSLSNGKNKATNSAPLRSLIDVYDQNYFDAYKEASRYLVGLKSLNDSNQSGRRSSSSNANFAQSGVKKEYSQDPFQFNEAKEAKELNQESLIDERDFIRSQKQENLLWSQLGIRKPEKFTYEFMNGNDQIMTEPEEAGNDESTDSSLRSVTE